MTRRGQCYAVIGILIGCLAVTALSAIGAQTFRRSPAVVTEGPAALARLNDIEPALARLLEAARRYTGGGDAASRAELERALARFGEACAPLGGHRSGGTAREESQLVETARNLTQRIDTLAREIAAVRDPHTDRPGPDKLALLTRLAEKVRGALGQLRAIPAVAGSEKIAGLAPRAAEVVVPEGLAVLFLTVVCAVSMALVSARRHLP